MVKVASAVRVRQLEHWSGKSRNRSSVITRISSQTVDTSIKAVEMKAIAPVLAVVVVLYRTITDVGVPSWRYGPRVTKFGDTHCWNVLEAVTDSDSLGDGVGNSEDDGLRLGLKRYDGDGLSDIDGPGLGVSDSAAVTTLVLDSDADSDTEAVGDSDEDSESELEADDDVLRVGV